MSWIARSEALAITGWTSRHLDRKVAAGEITSRPSKQKAANGRFVPEYDADTFPAEFRSKLAPDACTQALTIATPQIQFPAEPLKLDFANKEEEQEARRRYEIIEAMVKFEERREEYALLKLSDGSPVTSLTRMAKLLSEQHRISEVTLWRWYRRFAKQGGLVALADRDRSDKGTSRFFSEHPDAQIVAAYMYLCRRDSIRAAHESIVRYADRLQIAPTEVPSYETVRAWLTTAPPAALEVLAREGRKAYVERMAPYVSRGYTDVLGNQIWVSDHMIHDVEVMNDCFLDAPYGTPIRLRFTCLLDFRSRKVVGTSWAWEGSSRSIGTAMRHAVTAFGPCEIFYCDNGKDYRKVAKGAMPAYLRESPLAMEKWYDRELKAIENLGVMARLGIMTQHCLAYHPQSKHVERFFRTLHIRFDSKWTTYTSGSPYTRPDLTTVAMAEHRKLLRMGAVNRSLHPRASDFIRLCLEWLEEYNATPHSGRGMDNCSPNEIFAATLNPQQRPTPDAQTLALLLADRKTRKIRECAIELGNRRYIGADETHAAALHEHNEAEVIVAYDSLDPEEVAVLDTNGCLIAWAKSERLLPQSPAANAAIAESMQQRARLERSTRDTLSAISRRAHQLGVQSSIEVMADRVLPAPAETNDVLTHNPRRLKKVSAPDKDAVAPQSAASIAANLLEALK